MGVYQRGENWYVDFAFHGKRIREMIGPSRKGAEAVIAKRKTEIAEGKFLDIQKGPVPIKFHEFAKEYLAYSKTNKKSSTYTRELAIMRSFDREFEGRDIHEITAWQIEGWKSKRKEGHKPATVNRELALLKHMFSMAVKWRRVKESPTKDVKGLKGEGRRVRYLMPEEVQTLISNCKDFLKPIITVAVHTGLRKGELLGLRWPQVDFEQGIISVLDTKNHESRYVPMDETVKGILKGIKNVPGTDLVFSNRNGKQIDSAFLYLAFYEALNRSGITDFRWHDLRHVFASTLVMQGVDLNTVRELLGHKDLKMTLRYAHLAPNYKSKAVNVLDRVFDMSLNPPQAEKVIKLRP
jgi:integrase